MTREQLRDEIVACGRDPCHFIRKYVKIRHPTRGLIPFALFDYQEDLVKSYLGNRFNVILKARQLGISEITSSFAAWLMLFHRDKNILVMATKAETAKNIIKKVETAIENLPRWLMLADIATDNKLSIELSNGSVIKAIASSDDAGRSEALSLLILDEAAFVKNLDELWVGLNPTVQAGGRIIVLSTPNGVGNKFHQLYTEAEAGENDFKPARLMWWLHPERIADLEDDPDRPGYKTSTWYRNEIKASKMSPRDVAQELECNFNASGQTVVPAETLIWIGDGVIDPMTREHWDRNLFTWWEPEDGKKYMLTADVARGDGRDFSAAHVWDASSMEQAAEYYGKVPLDEFARLLVDLGRKYFRALLVIENNSIGTACLEHVKLAGYENAYYSAKGDHRPGEAVNTAWGTASSDLLVPGFTMSQRTRPLVVAKLEEYLRNKSMVIRSKRMLEELKTFIWNQGRPEAMRGYNDDLIMSAAMGAWIRDTFLSTSFVTTDVNKRLISGITLESHVNTQIDGASKDPRFVMQRALGVFKKPENPLKVRLPGGQVTDFSWLISKG
jgi:hypothetical protein